MAGLRSVILSACAWALRRPGWCFPLWFVLLIAVGTASLMLVAAVRSGVEPLSFLDALFTATSAVCTTGLTVRPPASLAPFAYVVIGVLIQCGGLGMVLFTAALIHKLHHRAGEARTGPDATDTAERGGNSADAHATRQFLRHALAAVVLVLLIELMGALSLMPMWRGSTTIDGDGDAPALSLVDRFGLSLFHAVSAFCNAGFTTANDSLAVYRFDLPVHLVLAGLLVAGGIGVPVLMNLGDVARARWRRWRREACENSHDSAAARLSLHSRVALSTSACLYLAGVLVLGSVQIAAVLAPGSNESLAGPVLPAPQLSAELAAGALADASFLSISSRTGGFTTVAMDEVPPAGRVMLMMLMAIGASPGGTGGGMKTTTFAVIVLTIVSTLRRHAHSPTLGQRVGDALVRQALTLAAVFLAVIAVAALLLAAIEPFPFERILFEAVSAASNTGLSLGITSDLSAPGKLIVAATMFLGALAPLAAMDAMIPGPLAFPQAAAHERVTMA